ncbi:hypothetical protein [Pseudoalteromonas arabiensis]|uniref:hypothetical protein n=1 Tax=Pseudoalteromonas arabiensis TaxID=874454 RepID=UPI000781F23B|nr:hypothetical protein [Pseudoalteromonas arabiensis]
MKIQILGISLFLLTACATTSTGPTPAGDNKYVMSRQEGAFPTGDEPLLQDVLQEANRFCESLSKKMELLNSTENSGPFVMGNYPRATITFKCE